QGEKREKADVEIQAYIKTRGMARFQAAVSSGQYTKPDGLFYGGTSASWSNQTFRQILKDQINTSVENLAVIDFHTGLGPRGYGEPISGERLVSGLARARRWYGPEVTCLDEGTSTSAIVVGSLSDAFKDVRSEVTFISLEYGTLSVFEVLTALRADNWLHVNS